MDAYDEFKLHYYFGLTPWESAIVSQAINRARKTKETEMIEREVTLTINGVKMTGTVAQLRAIADSLGVAVRTSSAGELDVISEMATPHLRNAINKYGRQANVHDIDYHPEYVAMIVEYAGRADSTIDVF